MQDKFELFNELPQPIQSETVKDLFAPDLVYFAMTPKKYWVLFKPLVDIHKLLHFVVQSRYQAVQSMLLNNMSLIFAKNQVTDCSGRTFASISAFQYALWALDKQMWVLILNCIPKSAEGKKVLKLLSSQYDQIIITGVTYRQNNKTITERHFDLKTPLLKNCKYK